MIRARGLTMGISTPTSPNAQHAEAMGELPIDADIEEVLGALDPTDHARAGLPFRVGLSSRCDARWSDFIQMPPNRDLPSWVCDDVEIARERVRRFDRAHHVAIAWGLVADRMDDGQVSVPERFGGTREGLLLAWRKALSDACGDRRLADAMIDEAMFAWEQGTRLEREILAQRAGIFAVDKYVTSIRARLAWVSTSATAMLVTAGQRARAEQLRKAYGTFLCGLQCRDDAFDEEEDRRARGVAVHEAFGLTRGALLRAAPRALLTAAEEAERGAFARLSTWIRAFAVKADVWSPDEDPHTQAFGALVLMSASGIGARGSETDTRAARRREATDAR